MSALAWRTDRPLELWPAAIAGRPIPTSACSLGFPRFEEFGAAAGLLLSIKVINFEMLKANPQALLDDVCAFIGAEKSAVPKMSFIPQRVAYDEKSQYYLARAARIEGYCGAHKVVVRLQRTTSFVGATSSGPQISRSRFTTN